MRRWTLGSVSAVVACMLPRLALAQDTVDSAAKPAEEAPAAEQNPTAEQAPAPAAEKTPEPATEASGKAEVSGAATAGVAAEPGASSEVKSETPAAAKTPEAVAANDNEWQFKLYGIAALNLIYDTTQALGEGLNNNALPRPGSYKAEHDQFQMTARDSRLGVRVAAPETRGIKSSARVEVDFRGLQSPEVNEHDRYIFGAPRMRYFYVEAKSPIVDLLAGQYDDLFGWGGYGFAPSTLGFLGVPGEVYHRQPQLRVSKTVGKETSVSITPAIAITRPVQKASGLPDGQAGLLFDFGFWQGARTPGYGQPAVGPLALGVSGLVRKFEVAEFMENPGGSDNELGYGYAINLLLPIIPVKDPKDIRNALTLTAEYSDGTGISDMYTELLSGARFPTLPDDGGTPPPIYKPNIDSAIVTFDGDRRLQTIDWTGMVFGLQYYLPIEDGRRLWISGTYSQVKSENLAELTPISFRQAVYEKGEYIDGNIFFALTESLRLSVSFQTLKQTFSDGVSTRNNRSEGAVHFFF